MGTKKHEQKPLTQTQIRYARQRVEALLELKLTKIKEEYEARGGRWQSEEVRNVLTAEIRAGRVQVNFKKLKEASSGESLHEVLYFDRFPNGKADAEKEFEDFGKMIELRKDACRAAGTKIIDDLVLGDAKHALDALAKFEKAVF